MSRELYKKHRPKNLRRLFGQAVAIGTLKPLIESNQVPHSLLFTGPSGCGKTTIARILKKELKCADADFMEVNCADFRGIDTIRDVRNRMNQSPIGGDCRIWLIDEAHMMTSQAQTAFLKMLEDTPEHVYFFLATTHPQKLLKTIKTRCTEIKLKEMTPKAQKQLIEYVLKREKKELSDEVVEQLILHGEESARKVLVLLNQIILLKTEEEQIDAIESADSTTAGFKIAQALGNSRTTWPVMAKILREVEEEPESLRWLIMSYATSMMIKGGSGAGRGYIIIDSFRDHFYDSKKAGLVAACYEVVGSK